MAPYECPDCGGGFPTPNPDHECPYCGTALDGSYGSQLTPLDNRTSESGPFLNDPPVLTASTTDTVSSDLTRYCRRCGEEPDNLIRNLCSACALDDTDHTQPMSEKL